MGPPQQKPQVWEIDDPDTGDVIEFDWDRPTPPTEADYEAVLKEYRTANTSPLADLAEGLKPAADFVTGVGKGLAGMVTAGGDMIRKAAPWTAALDVDTGGDRSALQPEGTAQKIGAFVGRTGLGAIPGVRAAQGASLLTAGVPAAVRVGAQMAAGAGTNALVGQTQGSETPKTDAAVGAAGPVLGATVGRVARAAAGQAVPLAKAALKTPIGMLKKAYPDASRAGLRRMGDRLANTVLNNRLFSGDDAQVLIDQDMKFIDDELAKHGSDPTNAARQVYGALQRLWRRADRSEVPEKVKAVYEAKMGEVLRNRFGEDVQTFIPKAAPAGPSPHFAQPRGAPVAPSGPVSARQHIGHSRALPPASAGALPPATGMTAPPASGSAALTPQVLPPAAPGAPAVPAGQTLNGQAGSIVTQRRLRSSVPVREVRAATLETDRFNEAWKGKGDPAAVADQAMSSAKRNAVKTAVPSTQPAFARVGPNIKARDVLDRMHVRDEGRDEVGLHLGAGNVAAAATGKPLAAIVGLAQHMLKNNQLRLGIYARDLEKALAVGDIQRVATIMQKVGVSAATAATNPDDIPMEGDMTISAGPRR